MEFSAASVGRNKGFYGFFGVFVLSVFFLVMVFLAGGCAATSGDGAVKEEGSACPPGYVVGQKPSGRVGYGGGMMGSYSPGIMGGMGFQLGLTGYLSEGAENWRDGYGGYGGGGKTKGTALMFGAIKEAKGFCNLDNWKYVEDKHVAVDCQLVSFDKSVIAELKKAGSKSESVIKKYLKDGKIRVLLNQANKFSNCIGDSFYLKGTEESDGDNHEVHGLISIVSQIEEGGESASMAVDAKYGIGQWVEMPDTKSPEVHFKNWRLAKISAGVSVTKDGTILLTLDDIEPIIPGKKLGVIVTPSIKKGGLAQVILKGEVIIGNKGFIKSLGDKFNTRYPDSASSKAFKPSWPGYISGDSDLRAFSIGCFDENQSDFILKTVKAGKDARTLRVPGVSMMSGETAYFTFTEGYIESVVDFENLPQLDFGMDLTAVVTSDGKYVLASSTFFRNDRGERWSRGGRSFNELEEEIRRNERSEIRVRIPDMKTFMIAGFKKQNNNDQGNASEKKLIVDYEEVIILITPEILKAEVKKDDDWAKDVIDDYIRHRNKR